MSFTALILNRPQDHSLASYPVEDPGFVRPSSWADAYRRMFELFESSIALPSSSPQK